MRCKITLILFALCVHVIVLGQETDESPLSIQEILTTWEASKANILKSNEKIKELETQVEGYEERLKLLEEMLLTNLAELQGKDVECEEKMSQTVTEKVNCTAGDEYQTIIREKKELEENHKKKNKEMEEKLAELEKKVNNLKEENEDLNLKNKNLNESKAKLENENNETNKMLKLCNAELNNCTENAEILDKNIDEMNTKLQTSNNENDELKSNISEIKEINENLIKENKNLKLNLTNLENINNDSKFQIINFVNELRKCENKFISLNENLDECKSEINLLDEDMKQLKYITGNLTEQNNYCNDQLNELHDESENFNKLNNICNLKLEQLKSQLLKEPENNTNNNCENCEKDKLNLVERNKELNEANRICENNKNKEIANTDYFRTKFNGCIGQLNDCDKTKRNSGGYNPRYCSNEKQILNTEINNIKSKFMTCNTDLESAKSEIIRINILITICNRKSNEFLERIGYIQEEVNNRNILILEMKKNYARIFKTAMIFKEQKKYEECYKILILILEAEKILYGSEHEEVIVTLKGIAHVLYLMEKFDDSLTINQNALEKAKRVLGENDKLTLQILNNLAVLQIARSDINEANRLFRILLAKQQELYGSKHPDTEKTLHYIAFVNNVSLRGSRHGFYKH